MTDLVGNQEKKKDAGKPMWHLLPYGPVGQIVDVLTFGANKYGPNGWQTVDNARERYFAAAMRHLTAWWGGEARDSESGLHHLAHAACCVLFLLYLDPPAMTPARYAEIHTDLTPAEVNAIAHPCSNCMDEQPCAAGLRQVTGGCIYYRPRVADQQHPREEGP